jgi:hypothetical protein
LQAALGAQSSAPRLPTSTIRSTLEAVLAVVFEVERTRGKVEEWYAGVKNEATVDLAKRLTSCHRKLEFLSATPTELQKLKGTIQWLDGDVTANLRRRVGELEHQLGLRLSGHSPARRLRGRLLAVARRADVFVQQRLGRRNRWLDPYMSVRGKLKRIVIGQQPPVN